MKSLIKSKDHCLEKATKIIINKLQKNENESRELRVEWRH